MPAKMSALLLAVAFHHLVNQRLIDYMHLIDIDSLSLHPILTTNVHPYGCYVSKFAKEGLF